MFVVSFIPLAILIYQHRIWVIHLSLSFQSYARQIKYIDQSDTWCVLGFWCIQM